MLTRGITLGYPATARARRTLAGAVLVFATLGSALACAPAGERPLRSPSRDYPAPPPQTSDGEVVGADRRDPADTLATGPTQDGLAPGWTLKDGKLVYDPNDRVGGQTEHDAASDAHDHAHGDAPLPAPASGQADQEAQGEQDAPAPAKR